jgi:hypothetical protein
MKGRHRVAQDSFSKTFYAVLEGSWSHRSMRKETGGANADARSSHRPDTTGSYKGWCSRLGARELNSIQYGIARQTLWPLECNKQLWSEHGFVHRGGFEGVGTGSFMKERKVGFREV